MSWQTGNLARAQNTREALNSASQIKQRGIDNFFKGTQQLQNVGLQMGQWKQNEKAQYRDAWAKLSAKEPTPPFEEWYRSAKEKNSGFNIMDLFKGKSENIGTTDTSVTPGSGYETRFQQMMMDYKTLQGEKEWENYKRTLEKETGVKFEDRPFEEQKQLRLDHERGRAAVGYGRDDADKMQGINDLFITGFQQYEYLNKKQDEMGNFDWRGEVPTKEQIIEALFSNYKDDPRVTGLLGTNQKVIKNRIKEWVDGNYSGLVEKKTIVPEKPTKLTKKAKNIPGSVHFRSMNISPEERKQANRIIEYANSANKTPEMYQEQMPRIEALMDRYYKITAQSYPSENELKLIADELMAILMERHGEKMAQRYSPMTSKYGTTGKVESSINKNYLPPYMR